MCRKPEIRSCQAGGMNSRSVEEEERQVMHLLLMILPLRGELRMWVETLQQIEGALLCRKPQHIHPGSTRGSIESADQG